MKKFAVLFFLLLVTRSIGAASEPKYEKTIEELLKDSRFLSQNKWAAAQVQEKVEMRLQGKTLTGRLSIANDRDNLYLLFVIYDDDFFSGKEGDTWADDRLFFTFDENYDHAFTENSEDRISILVREFSEKDPYKTVMKPVSRGKQMYTAVLSAGHGDWYYANKKKNWEYAKEALWEDENISEEQRRNGGPEMKEVAFFHTGPLTDGTKQDFAFEIKVPIHAKDPYDLQTKPGEIVGIGIKYGNLRDGYGCFPVGMDSDESPTHFFRYRLK